MATPPHLELLDGLERLGAVGQRLLQVLAVGHPQLLQPRVHGGPAGPPRPAPATAPPRSAPLPGPPAQRGPAALPVPRNEQRRTEGSGPPAAESSFSAPLEVVKSGNATKNGTQQGRGLSPSVVWLPPA